MTRRNQPNHLSSPLRQLAAANRRSIRAGGTHGDAVHAGSAGSRIPGDPLQRHDQRGRVTDEVVDIVKPATVVGHRPTVQLGLHLPYPYPGLLRRRGSGRGR